MHGLLKPNFKIDADLVYSFVPPGLCDLVGVDSIRMGASGGPSDYIVENAVLFDGATPSSMTRTFGTPTDVDIWTFSVIISAYDQTSTYGMILGCVSGGLQEKIELIDASNKLRVYCHNASGSGPDSHYITTQVFRDPAPFFHLVVTNDSTNATAADRRKVYINGTRITAWDTEDTITLNYDGFMNKAIAHYLGTSDGTNSPFSGLMADVYFIDGTEYAPTDFVEDDANGFWGPKAFTGTYGNNGFHLDFSNGANLGEDSSGNGNDWTATNVTQVTRTPTDSAAKGTSNHSRFDPLNYGSRSAAVTFSDGNQTIANSGGSADSMVLGTQSFNADDDTYFEIETTSGASLPAYIGICAAAGISFDKSANPYTNGTLVNYGYRSSSGNLLTDSEGEAGAAYGSSWTDGDRIGVRMNAGTLTFYKAGVSQGSAATGLTGNWLPMFIGGGGTWNTTIYTAADELEHQPAGTLTLTSIDAVRNQTGVLADHLQTELVNHDGSSTAFTLGWDTDVDDTMFCIKNRDTSEKWFWVDTNRGITKYVPTGTNQTEQTDANVISVSGTTVTLGSTLLADNYVVHCYRCTHTASGATTGLGTAKTYSTIYNPDAGWAFFTYVGNGTAGHTIPVPAMTDPKAPFFHFGGNLDTATGGYIVYHEALGGTKGLNILDTSASATSTTYWNDTAPTSSVVTLGTNAHMNTNNANYFRYCFWETDFCKPANWTGNNNADGAVIPVGFKPHWFLGKLYSTTGSWGMWDIERGNDISGYYGNPIYGKLFANDSAAEITTGDPLDFNSNLIKFRATGFLNAAQSGCGVIFGESEPEGVAQLRAQ